VKGAALKRALVIITAVILLILGGYLSQSLSSQNPGTMPGVRVQTENPNASVFTVTPDKGAYFFIFATIALVSVIGMGATMSVVFWLLNRQVERAKKTPEKVKNAPAS
jgi:flagellar basal body-associated protein FliL